ncbi:right-handed parallel beta-helix repeat-containing protein [uncultured Methanobrevibacter sp.]|uniref:right-handed parallel beta-helix repeat-containing protein n=1 Tax=uncultured Methanobrevibacter sp. TaxID=253161 RepID=UPI0025D42C62|nr:right-handed parallel beta-helix repeat-containing protein [uncultured Methanobrevibacter sp.]
MIKKFNIFLVLLLLFISVAAVSAVDNENMTEMGSNEAIQDTLEVSVDEDINYASDNSVDEVSINESDLLSSSSFTITESNYDQYFNSRNGELVSSDVKSGDTIILDGSFSKKNFIVNIPVNIVGSSSNDLKNSMVFLKSGASKSTVSNLNIANSASGKAGVVLDGADYCIVKDCIISNTGAGSYPISVINGANYNNVTGNNLKGYGISYGHGTRSTPGLIVSGSHYNYIANNYVEVDDANGIYLSSYSGESDDKLIRNNGGISNFNVIYNNTVKCNEKILPTSWCWLIQIMGNNNTIKSNTVIRGYRGITTAGSGNIIVGNTIINITGADFNHLGVETGGEYGIVGAYQSTVINNTVIGAKIISTGAGISAIDNSVVENNWVNITKVGKGINLAGSNVVVRNNTVYTVSGSGIYEKDEGSGLLVENNYVHSNSGVGILIEKVNSRRMPSNVTVIGNTVITENKVAIDASGVMESTSNIDVKSNNVDGKLIISPAGVIDTSKATFIFKGDTITITPSNIREYINDNGGLTSEVNDGDILVFDGTFNNEVIYVTKGVKITGKNPVFYNSTFKVTSGNVLIENLTIINREANRVNAWGIFINQASGVKIANNKITVSDPKAAYAVYVLESTEVSVLNNELTSEGDYLTFTLLSYASENCTFANNTIKTFGTGEVYSFIPEKCIDGNEITIDGKQYCIDGNELLIDGKSYCIDGNELVIDGRSYCIDGNELVIDGQKYCIDGNELVIDGRSYCIDGNELTIDGKVYCIDGNELVIDGRSYCIDGNELVIDGQKYCIDGNELVIDGRSYCIDGNELTIDGKVYCIDGNELVIDGKKYCIDGNELCIDGAEYAMGESHVISEIYQTYGILLLYSSNNEISGNDVNVTSKLASVHATTGKDNSTNSLVGIDLYFNSHNNVFSNNNIYIKANDNYIYGMGVLGYNTGHTAPEGQGATNNRFEGNEITLEGPYFTTGLIVGSSSEQTLLKDNVVNLKSPVSYGITLEMSQKSTIENNVLNLNADVVYGIDLISSSDNVISNNTVVGEGKQVYGMLISNGKNNGIRDNSVKAKGNGENLTFKNLDSLGFGNAGIYLRANSTNNEITGNNITSAKGYSILADSIAVSNVIADNYLESEKGIADKAVSVPEGNNVSDNYVYVAEPLSVSAGDVAYMGTGTFTITFDKIMDGAVVKFYDSDGVLFAQSEVSNGIATASYKFDATFIPAQYIFSAKTSRENYNDVTSELKFTITKGNIVIDMADISIEQGNPGNIVAKLLDEFGNPIANTNVQFKRINSAGRATPIGSAVTDKEGIAVYNYEVPESLEPGSHVITSEVASSDYYNGANSSSTLQVIEKITITGNKAYSVYYGNTVTYKVRIVSTDTKNPIVGKAVTFKIKDKTKTVNTDSNGYASYSVKLPAGSYTITATCENKQVSNKITFKPTVIAKNLSKKKAKTIKYTVKVVDKKGKVVKNKKVTFKVKNKKYTAKTNKKGIATLTLKNFKVGKYLIYSTYSRCTVKTTLTVKK